MCVCVCNASHQTEKNKREQARMKLRPGASECIEMQMFIYLCYKSKLHPREWRPRDESI